MLQYVAQLSCDAINATSAFICRMYPETDTLDILAIYTPQHPTVAPTNTHQDVALPELRQWLAIGAERQFQYAGDAAILDELSSYLPITDVQSALMLPFSIGSTAVGFVLVGDSRQARDFTSNEIQFIKAIANQISITLENSQLNIELSAQQQQLQEKNRQLVALMEAGTAMVGKQNLEFVLTTFTETITNLFAFKRCTIYEWLPELNAVQPMASYGFGETEQRAVEGTNYNLDESPLTKQVIETNNTVQMTFSMQDIHPHTRQYMIDLNVKTIIVLPLRFQDQTMGVIIIEDTHDHVLTDDELALARLLTNQATVAVKNARLYEQLKHEINDRIDIESRLRESLNEKNTLLKEVHHRVKNNLQVISSLLRLQSRTVSGKEVTELLQDSQSRIQSMALVHELLYQSDDLTTIDLGEYLDYLVHSLSGSYDAGRQQIAIQTQTSSINVPIECAITCGLLLNELISNSIKHAFPPDTSGTIEVALNVLDGGQIELCVADNGVGLPDDLESRRTNSLGLQLIDSFVQQLDATMTVQSADGVKYVIVMQTVGGENGK